METCGSKSISSFTYLLSLWPNVLFLKTVSLIPQSPCDADAVLLVLSPASYQVEPRSLVRILWSKTNTYNFA